MKRIICLWLTLCMVTINAVCVSAENVGISDFGASRHAVWLTLENEAENVNVYINGKTEEAVSDGTNISVKLSEALKTDNRYTLVVNADGESTALNFILKSKFSDEFSDGIDGWTFANPQDAESKYGGKITHENGKLKLETSSALNYAYRLYYDGADNPFSSMSSWKDYTVDIDLDIPSSNYRFYLDLLNNTADDTNKAADGYTYMVRTSPMGGWFAGIMQNNYRYGFNVWSTSDIDNPSGYIKYLSSNPQTANITAQVKDNVQTMYINGERTVATEFDSAESGGFTMDIAGSSSAVYIDSVYVYECLYESANDIPYAENPSVSGSIKEGNTLKGNYVYKNNDNIEEEGTQFAWYASDTSDGIFERIENETGDTLYITADYADKYIKFSVKPIAKGGIEGLEVFSGVLTPLRKPYADNVKISGTAAAGAVLNGSYEYYDENGDEESESVYAWYISENEDGPYSVIDGEKEMTYTVRNTDKGKYIKFGVTPISSEEPFEGGEVLSECIYIENSVKLVNASASRDSITMDILGVYLGGIKTYINGEEAACSADGATVTVTPKESLSCEKPYIIAVETEEQTIYIKLSFDVMVDDDFERYENSAALKQSWTGGVFSLTEKDGNKLLCLKPSSTPMRSNLYSVSEQLAWRDYCVEFDILNDDADFALYIDGLFDGTDGYTAFIRNYTMLTTTYWTGVYKYSQYSDVINHGTLGAGKETDYMMPIVPPDMPMRMSCMFGSDKQSAAINGRVIKQTNMTGHESGYTGFRILRPGAEDTRNVYLDNILIYKSNLELMNDGIPVVSDVKINGTVEKGGKLSAAYTYSHTVKSIAEAEHKYRWLYSDSADGEYLPIENADGREYIVGEEYADKFIKVEITPCDINSAEGIAVLSQYVCSERAPEAENVGIDGIAAAGEKIKGKYDFRDYNFDKEGESKYRWLHTDKNGENPVPISNADSLEYTVADSDMGKYLVFEVEPASENPSQSGNKYYSEPVYIYYRPTAENVSIKEKSTGLYVGEYTYTHKDRLAEGESKYEWYINGSLISNEKTCYINGGSGRLEFRVTPVTEKNKIAGATETTFKILSTGSGGGTGGGGGGSNVQIRVVTPQATASPAPTLSVCPDLEGFWGRESAEKMMSFGIMKPDEKNMFCPQVIINRAEFTDCIIKTLGLTKSVYKDGFEDISADDWFADSVQTALDRGFISKDTYFNPYRSITREEAAKITANALNFSLNNTDSAGVYRDKADISDWAVKYVSACTAEGIMEGDENLNFMPKKNITRAETAALLCKVYDKLYAAK